MNKRGTLIGARTIWQRLASRPRGSVRPLQAAHLSFEFRTRVAVRSFSRSLSAGAARESFYDGPSAASRPLDALNRPLRFARTQADFRSLSEAPPLPGRALDRSPRSITCTPCCSSARVRSVAFIAASSVRSQEEIASAVARDLTRGFNQAQFTAHPCCDSRAHHARPEPPELKLELSEPQSLVNHCRWRICSAFPPARPMLPSTTARCLIPAL